MNDTELATLARTLRIQGNDEKQQAIEFIKTFKLECLLVTRGEQGAWLMDKNGKFTASNPSASAVEVVDTVGAGDAFAAVFIVGRLLDWPAAQTLERAGTFAAAICGIHGAVPQNQDFYSKYLQEWNLAMATQ